MIALLGASEPSWLRQHWLRILWNVGSIKVATNDEGLWVHSDTVAREDGEKFLRMLPGGLLFEDDSPLGLRPIGQTMVSRAAPKVEWSSPASLAALELPSPSPLAPHAELENPKADQLDRTRLTLMPAKSFREPSGVICKIEDWLDYALRTPLFRFRHLQFAARNDGSVLIIGAPIPSLRGMGLVEKERILVPCSYDWYPSVPADTIKRLLSIEPGTWLLWSRESLLESIPDEHFISSTRSSIRATFESIGKEGFA